MEALAYIAVGVVLVIAAYCFFNRTGDSKPATPPSTTVIKQLEERNEILKAEIEGVEGEYEERKKNYFDRFSKYIKPGSNNSRDDV
jgi:hypothetical protein